MCANSSGKSRNLTKLRKVPPPSHLCSRLLTHFFANVAIDVSIIEARYEMGTYCLLITGHVLAVVVFQGGQTFTSTLFTILIFFIYAFKTVGWLDGVDALLL
jgi:hypothetical protein